MKNKTMLKKIVLIAVLVVIVVSVVIIAVNSSSGKKEAKTGNTNTMPVPISSKATSTQNTISANSKVEKKAVTKQELNDGMLYSVTDEEIVPDIVVGDNYFDTQIADMNLNFDEYEGKTIEIEGLYFSNDPYMFVGRYSLSNICPDCPTGYSYFEYEWNGDETIELEDEESWIKVLGTLKKGNDGVEYYYIDVASLEVMNEKGIDTVSN